MTSIWITTWKRKGYEDENDQFQEDETEVEDRRYTNALIVIVAIAGMFWYFDWNPREIYQNLLWQC